VLRRRPKIGRQRRRLPLPQSIIPQKAADLKTEHYKNGTLDSSTRSDDVTLDKNRISAMHEIIYLVGLVVVVLFVLSALGLR